MTWVHLPSSPFSPEQAADFWQANISSDGEQSAMSNGTNLRSSSSKRGSKTARSMTLLSGTQSQHLTASSGVDLWMLSLRAFRANHTASQVSVSVLRMNAISGRTPYALLEKSGPNGSYWKMSQGSFPLIMSDEYSQTWPKKGLILHGRAYLLSMSVRRIFAKDYGLWPTPTVGDAGSRRMSQSAKESGGGGMTLTEVLGGKPNPRWSEWLMGWPEGWANNSSPLAMDKFQQWLHLHGKA